MKLIKRFSLITLLLAALALTAVLPARVFAADKSLVTLTVTNPQGGTVEGISSGSYERDHIFNIRLVPGIGYTADIQAKGGVFTKDAEFYYLRVTGDMEVSVEFKSAFGGEMITDGNFARGTTGQWGGWGNGGVLTWSQEGRTSDGTGSVLIDNTNTEYAARFASQNIWFTGRSTYRLSFWVKTEDLLNKSGNTGAFVTFEDGSEVFNIGFWYSGGIGQKDFGTHDWTYFETDFYMANTEMRNLRLRLWGCIGKAWFDDVSIICLDRESFSADYTADEGGIVSLSYADVLYDDFVTCTAIPSDGYAFTGWSDGNMNSKRTDKITKNFTVRANFAKQSFSVLFTAGEGGKVVGELSPSYEYGSLISVKAVPDEGYIFTGWSDGYVSADRAETVRADISAAALFTEKNEYEIEYSASVGGSISGGYSSPAAKGSEITITAVPNEGYAFKYWTDGLKTATRTDIIDSAISVRAVFYRIEYFNVAYSALAGGTVQGDLGSFAAGSMVTALAAPDEGYIFAGWSDGIKSSSRQDIVVSDLNLAANFQRIEFTASYLASEGGSVTGSGTTLRGGKLSAVAVPDEGYVFSGWSDNVASAEREDILYGDLTVTASFIKLPVKLYEVNYTSSNGGYISGNYDKNVTLGSVTQVRAVAEPGYEFVRWSDGLTAEEREDMVDGNLSVQAIFEASGSTCAGLGFTGAADIFPPLLILFMIAALIMKRPKKRMSE